MTSTRGHAVPIGDLSDLEKMTAIVRAAKTYDHDNRPQGNWGSVPDAQVARLIIGALGALEFAEPTQEPQPAHVHVTYDGDTQWLACFADDPDSETGDVFHPIEPGDWWGTLTAKVREHQAEHGCAQQPVPEGDAQAESAPAVTE